MKRRLVLVLCSMLILSGCGTNEIPQEVSQVEVSSNGDITTDEAIKYAQDLFKSNVDDSDSADSLLDNMINDAVDDFTGSDTSESVDIYSEESNDMTRFDDVNFYKYCTETLGLSNDVTVELSPENITWYDMICISNSGKFKGYIGSVKQDSPRADVGEPAFEYLKIEDCNLNLKSIAEDTDLNLYSFISELYNSNSWDYVIDSGLIERVDEDEDIIDYDVDLSTPEKVKDYINSRFDGDDLVQTNKPKYKKLVLSFVYFVEDNSKPYEFGALSLAIERYTKNGSMFTELITETDDVWSSVHNLGDVGVYSEEEGFQWMWDRDIVLLLHSDIEGNNIIDD